LQERAGAVSLISKAFATPLFNLRSIRNYKIGLVGKEKKREGKIKKTNN